MSGLSTHERFAIVEAGRGLNVDTYDTFDNLVWAAMYKLCAAKGGSTDELRQAFDSVLKQVKEDWK